MLNDNDFLIRFTDCIPVKGENRSIICDLTRKSFEFIPNDLYDFLQSNNKLSWKQIKEQNRTEDLPVIQEYLEFLLEKEFIFWGKEYEIECFPEIETTFQNPFIITNAIIEINPERIYLYCNAIKQILKLGAKKFQLRIYQSISEGELFSILNEFDLSRADFIEIFLPYSVETQEENLKQLIEKFPRIAEIYVFGAPQSSEIEHLTSKILVTVKQITSSKDFIPAEPKLFIINIEHYTEALKFNTYFNQKIAIDFAGNIKNSPEHEEYFGNILDANIETIVNSSSFQKLWHISKTQIKICNTCEFRYICFDSRKPVYEHGKYFYSETCNLKM